MPEAFTICGTGLVWAGPDTTINDPEEEEDCDCSKDHNARPHSWVMIKVA